MVKVSSIKDWKDNFHQFENPASRRGYSAFHKNKYYFRIVKSDQDPETKKHQLCQMAIDQDHAIGKWLLKKVKVENVDYVWSQICHSILFGDLKNITSGACVSKNRNNFHTICVHTFFDEVENTIKAYDFLKAKFSDILELSPSKDLHYKPDIFGWNYRIYHTKSGFSPFLTIDYFYKK